MRQLNPRKLWLKDIVDVSVPLTFGRLIGNIGYFFEPAVLTFVMIKCGYDKAFVVREYGVLSGFVLPLLLLPSFFTMTISQVLLPRVARSNDSNLVLKGVFISFVVGVLTIGIILATPEFYLNLLYGSTEGLTYLKFMAPFFILLYLQSPISASLQALGLTRVSTRSTILGVFLKLGLIYLLTHLQIGMWSLVFASTINIIFVTTHDFYFLLKKIAKD